MYLEKKEHRIDTTLLLPICDYFSEEVGHPSGVSRKSVRYNLMQPVFLQYENILSVTAVKPEKLAPNAPFQKIDFPFMYGAIKINYLRTSS